MGRYELKPGDKIAVLRGPYRGETVQLRSRTTEYDIHSGERRAAWFVWHGKDITLVFEDELNSEHERG
jgi:galactose mutarotase-like enzyme